MASESEQLVIDQYDLSRDDEEYLILDNVVETSTKQKEHTALYLTAARNDLNSPCEARSIATSMVPAKPDYLGGKS